MIARVRWAWLLAVLALPAWADKPVIPENIAGTTMINAERLVELVLNEPELVIVDSRRFDEYAKGHIEGAVNLLDATMTEQALASRVPGKSTPMIFYCNGPRCRRSSNAVRKALEWGYRNIYWFRGGWAEWRSKEMPVAK